MAKKRRSQPAAGRPTTLRIIGGEFRGRRLKYHGDPRTRPMKDRVREAAFNLIGPGVKERVAIDLFAGTGALALEALSRGARRAILIERHFPSAKVIQENVALLGLAARAEVVAGDTFRWIKQLPLPRELPWLVLCSPPYAFYEQRWEALSEMLEQLIAQAPQGSLFVVEFDRRLDAQNLPAELTWDTRHYPPAFLAVATKEAPETPAPETPAPETPAPETPAPETPAPETESEAKDG